MLSGRHLEEAHGDPKKILADKILNGLREKDLSQRDAAEMALTIQRSLGMRPGESKVDQSFLSRLSSGHFPGKRKGGYSASGDTRYRAVARLLDMDEAEFIREVEAIQKGVQPEGGKEEDIPSLQTSLPALVKAAVEVRIARIKDPSEMDEVREKVEAFVRSIL